MMGDKVQPDVDQSKYWCFTGPQRADKALGTLDGLVRGISADRELHPDELNVLDVLLIEHEDLRTHSIVGPLMDLVRAMLDEPDAPDFLHDVAWRLRTLSDPTIGYYDIITKDLQRLHALLGGLAADGIVRTVEVERLRDWLVEHENLAGSWPFDEVCSAVTRVLADGVVSPEESDALLAFFRQFGCNTTDAIGCDFQPFDLSVQGICSTSPEILFPGSLFVVTGRSTRGPRRVLRDAIERLGGSWRDAVSRETTYLIVCAARNKAWAYEAFGRKIEQALALRREGLRLMLVHENDFWDVVADA